MENVRIRALKNHADYEACVRIQRKVWRHEDLHLTPVPQFCISVQTGAILLGAFIGKDMAGFVYAFPAVFGKVFCQHSHLLAVLPACQGYGIGKKLKWAQRKEGMKRGYDLITWTFDPLQARNANLNLNTLGAVGRTYLNNFYGCTPSLMLGPGVPTDRFLVEWWIRTKRVAQRQMHDAHSFDLEEMGKAVEQKAGGVYPRIAPRHPVLSLKEKRILAEVPKNIRDLRRDPGLIAAWQKAIRTSVRHYFSRGYRLDDFIFGDRSFYVLKKERIIG
jgi:predicted GNAT superfamily acetyltransferase